MKHELLEAGVTRLDYTKIGEADPGRVIEVSESGVWSGDDTHPFEPASKRRQRQAREGAALAARSEEIRYQAMIKKFGEERSIELGVPRKFVEAQREAKERERHRHQRAQLKRERQAAARAGNLLKTQSPKI